MIKTFEQYTNIPKFKTGDYVKCVDTDGTLKLIYNNVYIVSGNLSEVDGYRNYIELEGLSDHTYNEIRFIIPSPEEIKQYKIEQDSNKYNL